MGLPTAYLTSFKNVKGIFEAMQSAQAPKKFTVNFLQGLGFKGPADRLFIGVLKALGFLTAAGEPTQRYFQFLDQSQSARVLAEGVQEAYADLYQVNTKAHELSNGDIKNKLKTLTQGQFSDSVLEKMAGTFKVLSAQADFSSVAKPTTVDLKSEGTSKSEPSPDQSQPPHQSQPRSVHLGGLVYNIQIHLPESRDQAVYDVLFRSMKEHLL